MDNERLQIAYYAILMLTALCVAQVAWLLLAFTGAPVVAVAVFVSGARVLMYWASSMMLYVWLSLVTRQLTNVSSARNTKRIIALSIIATTSVLILLAIGLAVSPLGSPQFLAFGQIGKILLFGFGAISLSGFAISGSLLIRKVDNSASAAKRMRDSSTRRIKRLTIAFCVVYTIHTLVVLISAAAPDFYYRSFNVFISIYLLADISGVVTVLVICRSIIAAQENSSGPFESGGGGGGRYTKRLSSHSVASVLRSGDASPSTSGYKRESCFRNDAGYTHSPASRSSDSPRTPRSQNEPSTSYNQSVFTQTTTRGGGGPPFIHQASEIQLAALHDPYTRLDTIHDQISQPGSFHEANTQFPLGTPVPAPQPFPWEGTRVSTRATTATRSHTRMSYSESSQVVRNATHGHIPATNESSAFEACASSRSRAPSCSSQTHQSVPPPAHSHTRQSIMSPSRPITHQQQLAQTRQHPFGHSNPSSLAYPS